MRHYRCLWKHPPTTLGSIHPLKLLDRTLLRPAAERTADDLMPEIRPVTPTDRPAVLSLWEDRLGEGYTDHELLDAAISPDEETAIGFVADTISSGLCGFGLGRLGTPTEAANYLDVPIDRIEHSESIGVLSVLCIATNHEGQGIGTALIEARLAELYARGCTAVYTVSWLRGNHRDSSSLFQSLGFERVANLPEKWRIPSKLEGFSCPDCGNPCTCDATLFVR